MKRSASFCGDFQVRREPERAHAVEDAEVDHFGRPALLGRHQKGIHPQDVRRGRPVDVLARLERRHEGRVLGDVGEDAQLDLAVIGDHQPVARGATNARRMRWPISVRMGMFCRFGLAEEKPAVAATA